MLFEDEYTWKGYELTWCNRCNSAIIVCKECKNTSCNAGSCDKCSAAFDEFIKFPIQVENYLTQEEITAYSKARRLKDLIIESLDKGQERIDFKKCKADGEFSIYACELFAKELKDEAQPG